MRGAIPPLPQYAFTTWCSVKSAGTNLPFTFYVHLLNVICQNFEGYSEHFRRLTGRVTSTHRDMVALSDMHLA
jgi:hypothetical protein